MVGTQSSAGLSQKGTLSGRVVECLGLLVLVGLTVAASSKLALRAEHGCDDVSIYYHAARSLVAGQPVYLGGKTSFLYPPFFALLIAPLAAASPATFALVWSVLLAGCWFLAVILVHKILEVGARTVPYSGLLASLVLFRWIWSGWGHGQVALLLLVLVLAALVCERRGRYAWTATWTALAGGIKVFPLFIALLLLKRGEWRSLALLVGLVLLWIALPVVSVGFGGLYDLYICQYVRIALAEIHNQQWYWDNRSPIVVLYLSASLDSGRGLLLCTFGMALACFGSVLFVRRPSQEPRLDALWLSFAVCGMLVACPVVWPHYFTLLLLPVATLIDTYWRLNANQVFRRVLLGAVLLLTLVLYANAPWLVGERLSNVMDKWPHMSLGLVVLWCCSLAATCVLRPMPSEPNPLRVG